MLITTARTRPSATRMDLHEGGLYWIGGSHSPDQVRIHGFEPMGDPRNPTRRFVLFERVPLRSFEPAPERMEEDIFRLLAGTGMQNRIETMEGYASAHARHGHSCEDIHAEIAGLQMSLAGSNPANVHAREDCSRMTVHIAHPAGEDAWSKIDALTGGCCNSRTNDPDASGNFTYECSCFGVEMFDALDKAFNVREVRIGDSPDDQRDALRAIVAQRAEQSAAITPSL